MEEQSYEWLCNHDQAANKTTYYFNVMETQIIHDHEAQTATPIVRGVEEESFSTKGLLLEVWEQKLVAFAARVEKMFPQNK